MFKNPIAVLSLVVSVVVAQDGLIPSGISSSCETFLKSLNTDSRITPCLEAMSSATANFAPGSSGAKSPSTSAVTSALGNLCTSDKKCPSGVVRETLAKFASECSSEIRGGNDLVTTYYDSFYSIIPLRDAVCSKDESGSWCLTTITKDISAETKTALDNYLVVQNRALVNATTYCASNVAFAFLNPSLPSDKLCTPCTGKIMSSYIDFESNTPYAPGFGQSKLLCGQSDLYDKVTSTCPDLLGGAVQAAGGLSAGIGSDSNAALSSFTSNMKAVAATVLAAGVLALL